MKKDFKGCIMQRILSVMSVVILLFTAGVASSFAADPDYYNFNTGGSGNNFPLNMASGKKVQWLYLPGEFNQPSAAPAGLITSISFFMNPAGSSFTKTYTDFTIMMGQDSITSFTAASFYAGSLTTVYYRSSVDLTGAPGQWMTITLDTPFAYDPSQSLILDVAQSGISAGAGQSYVSQTVLSPIRRVWSVGGPPFTPYAGGDSYILNAGLTIVPTNVTVPAATGNGDITLSTNSPGCGFTSWAAKTEAQVGDDPLYKYPYGLVEFTLNCDSADVTITFPGNISAAQYRKYGPTTPGDINTTAWYDFSGTIAGNQITLHLVDGQLGDDTGVDGIIVDQGGPGEPLLTAATVPTLSEWGMILFMLIAGAGSIYYLRRQGKTAA